MTQAPVAQASGWLDPMRFAVGTFTRFPVQVPAAITREVTGRGLALGPAVGAAVGLVSAVPLLAGPDDPVGRLLSATLALALAAWLTRALHWDGLADLADGLGAGGTAERALAVMRRSDVGPFGVLTLVLTLAVQVVALARLPAGWVAAAAWVLALAAGRAAIAIGSGPGTAPARRDGLGVAVIGSVTAPLLVLVAAQMVLIGSSLVILRDISALAVLVGAPLSTITVALVVRVMARKRLGGSTGDVLGATAELTTAAVLLMLAWP